MVDSVNAIASLANPVGLSLVIAFGVGHGHWIINGLVFIASMVARRRLEWVMHCLERKVEQERIFISYVKKIKI